MLFLLLYARLSPNAGPAAASREEAATAYNSGYSSNCSPESRAATARTGHCTAEGEEPHQQTLIVSFHILSTANDTNTSYTTIFTHVH